MIVKEITAKSCLTKSKLTDYVVNPYLGCEHGCVYCYAVFMKRFHNISERWGDFVHVKINCADLLERELKKNKPGHVWFSSVTDAYHPVEGKYRLTRRILEIIAESPHGKGYSVDILSKSALVRRDFDIISRLDSKIGCSVNNLDAKVARIIEPLASPPELRIKAAREAKELGIPVYGFISPVIPGLTRLDEIFRELQFCDYVWVELLNSKPSVMSRLMPVLRRNFPQAVPVVQASIARPDEYFEKMREKVSKLESKYSLRVHEIIRHEASNRD